MFYTQMNCLIDDLNDNIEQYQQKHLKSAHLRFASIPCSMFAEKNKLKATDLYRNRFRIKNYLLSLQTMYGKITCCIHLQLTFLFY